MWSDCSSFDSEPAVLDGSTAVAHFETPAIRASTLKHNREILFGQAHAAGGRQEFVGDGGGRQGHIDLPAQLQREQHVFLHHVHVEPCLFGHVQHERAAILHHRRRDHAVRQHVHGGLARDAAFFRKQHAFRKRQHLHGEAEVGRDLHHEREAVLSDVRHFRVRGRAAAA